MRRDRLFEQYPAIKAIYEQMHALRILVKHKRQSRKQCQKHTKALLAHIHQLKQSGLAPLQTLASKLTRWIEPIALSRPSHPQLPKARRAGKTYNVSGFKDLSQ
ncbi:MAG: transposase [Opitutales bacterium]